MDISDGAETAAGRQQGVVGLHAGQLAYPTDGHGGGGGGVRHGHGDSNTVTKACLKKIFSLFQIISSTMLCNDGKIRSTTSMFNNLYQERN